MLSDVFAIIFDCYKWVGVLGRCPERSSQKRVTHWSGCIGLKALVGSRAEPSWDGARPSPSGEPTTTKAKRVVIVGYNKASLVVRAAPSGLRLLFILPSVRSMSATLQLTAVRLPVFFLGTMAAQVVVQVIVRPIVNGLV